MGTEAGAGRAPPLPPAGREHPSSQPAPLGLEKWHRAGPPSGSQRQRTGGGTSEKLVSSARTLLFPGGVTEREKGLAKALLAGRNAVFSVSVCLSPLGLQGATAGLPLPLVTLDLSPSQGVEALHCLGAKTARSSVITGLKANVPCLGRLFSSRSSDT